LEDVDKDDNDRISHDEYNETLSYLYDNTTNTNMDTIANIIIHLLNNTTTELKPRELIKEHPAYTSNYGIGRTMSINNTHTDIGLPNTFDETSYYGDSAEIYNGKFVFISPTYIIPLDLGIPIAMYTKGLYGLINYDEYDLTSRSWAHFINQIRDGTPENIYESSHILRSRSHIHSNVENIFYNYKNNKFIHPTHESLNNEDLPQIEDLSRNSSDLPAGINITMYLRYDYPQYDYDNPSSCQLVIVKGNEVVKSIVIDPRKNYVWAYLEWTE
jgi:hypothetical protein